MADTKIKDLTPKTTVVDSDEIVINDVAGGNVDKKIGLDDLKTYTSLSPSLVTPALGTPASGVATNITGLPVAGLATGTDGELITWDSSGDPATVAVGTSGQVLTSNGAGAAPTFQAAAGGFTTVYKTADETINSNTTLTDDEDITFSVDASSTYAIAVVILYNTDTAPDFKYAFSIPSGASGIMNTGFLSGGANESFTGAWTTASSPIVSFGGNFAQSVVGNLQTTSAGTFALQWAQNTSDAANTKLLQGTWLMYKKLN